MRDQGLLIGQLSSMRMGSLKVPPESAEMANQTFGLVADVPQVNCARCSIRHERWIVDCAGVLAFIPFGRLHPLKNPS